VEKKRSREKHARNDIFQITCKVLNNCKIGERKNMNLPGKITLEKSGELKTTLETSGELKTILETSGELTTTLETSGELKTTLETSGELKTTLETIEKDVSRCSRGPTSHWREGQE
jgi:hypothetical protein